MKFYVSKTSEQNTQPCENAFMEYSKECERNMWFIEINSLEELIDFMDKTKNKSIVLLRDFVLENYSEGYYCGFDRVENAEYPMLEIYDNYRE